MIGHRVSTGVAVIAALVLSAGLASASTVRARPKARNATAAVHTATARHRVHRFHHHAPGAVIAANRMAPVRAVSFPERPIPARQHPRRETLPALAQSLRHAPSTRHGPRHAPVAMTPAATWALAARTLEVRRESTPDPRILTVSGGRGPPRGSPIGPSRGRATPAPASADDPDARVSASPVIPAAALPTRLHPLRDLDGVRPGGAFSGARHVSVGVSEAGSCRLHADRPEGATACYSMPSNGGNTCPASSPSPC
jgi:hypothetical protein